MLTFAAMSTRENWKDKLYSIRHQMRKDSRVHLPLPAQFTFNRSGTKYFDTVLNFFNWDLHDVPVEIDFTSCDSANYQAISLLIPYAWRLKQQGCAVSFKLQIDGEQNGSRVWRLMGAQGLFPVATDPKTNFRYNEFKPLFAIRNSDDFKESLATADSFTSTYGIEYQKTLRYVLSELLYNTLEHGKSDFYWQSHRFPTPSILQFTWYEKINELHFIVADTGVGIRSHLSQAYPTVGSDDEAIQLAIQPEVSGTFGRQDPYLNRNNAGMGLYLSSNIIRRLHADMHIISGHGIAHISPVDTTYRHHSFNWPGTFVLVTVRLDRGTKIALDSLMTEFREQAKKEVDSRNAVNASNKLYVNIFNYFGRFADDKDAGIKFRDRYLIPAVDEGRAIVADFSGVDSSTHSFLNALFASPIRRMGLVAYKRIRVINATNEIRETMDYVLDDNTSSE